MYKKQKWHNAARTKEVRLSSYGKTFICGGPIKQLQSFLRDQRGAYFSLLSLEGMVSLKESDLYREFGDYSPLVLTRRILQHPECSRAITNAVNNLVTEIGEDTNFWRQNPRSVYNPLQLVMLCNGMAQALADTDITYTEYVYEGSDQCIYVKASDLFKALSDQMTRPLPPPPRDYLPLTTYEWLQYIMKDLHDTEATTSFEAGNMECIVEGALEPPQEETVCEFVDEIPVSNVPDVTEADVLSAENIDAPEEEKVVIPDKTLADDMLYPERRTRCNIKCSAVMDFIIPLSMPRTQIEAYMPLVQRSVKDPNMCLSLGEGNSVSVVLTVEELMNSAFLGERAAAHSHDELYDKTLAISKRIKAIEDAFIDLAYKEHELTERLNCGSL